MQRVLDGTLERGQLPKECLRRQCEDMCSHMMEVTNAKTMSAGQFKKGKMTVATWADVEEKYPHLAATAYLEGRLLSYKGRPRKQPPPGPFINAIVCEAGYSHTAETQTTWDSYK